MKLTEFEVIPEQDCKDHHYIYAAEKKNLVLYGPMYDTTIVASSLEEAVDNIAVKTKGKNKSEVKIKSVVKLTKQERIEKYFRRELTDASGVET